ncbi:protein of unknown function [Myxococcus fulvus]|uniref:DUF4126 domain-containing protein n=1 Tax=Myxococcus fulvus TaxID=33 RepID=A0A511T5S0_MYXFU|nr:DUF4126 domain-containing protein [Myxococcus fulvus]AKF85906.1 hypothetical protein MFUL124B02_18245 [Myxococcus fulvus 124B02]GEN09519.1 hypothetical protein MFU01_45560 [Myxococcus fulvus]SEU32733.1 protein of unknown function [Myxococcus fulvus]
MLTYALVSQAIGLSGASGTRAGGSLLLLALAAHAQYLTLPPELTWLATPQALGAMVALLAFEMYTQRDSDLRMVLGLAQFALSAGSGATVALASVGVGTEGLPPWAVGAVGAFVAVSTLSLRQWLHTRVDHLETEVLRPRKWLLRIEDCFGLGLAAVAILWAPLALVLVLLFTAACAVAGWLAYRLEARGRRPCPAGCGARIRQEASRCPKCHADVPIARRLDLRLAGRMRDALQSALGSGTSGVSRADPSVRRGGGKLPSRLG